MGKPSHSGSSPLSRREFGTLVAGATGAAAVVPGDGGPHDPIDQDDGALRRLSAEGRVRFESMWQNVLRKHADRLSDDQKARLRKIIATNVTMLDAIYAVPVKNDDTPATMLLLVGDTGGRPRPSGATQTKRTTVPPTKKP